MSDISFIDGYSLAGRISQREGIIEEIFCNETAGKGNIITAKCRLIKGHFGYFIPQILHRQHRVARRSNLRASHDSASKLLVVSRLDKIPVVRVKILELIVYLRVNQIDRRSELNLARLLSVALVVIANE